MSSPNPVTFWIDQLKASQRAAWSEQVPRTGEGERHLIRYPGAQEGGL
jgi:hypothetical protein